MVEWFVEWLEHHRRLTACDDTAIDCLASGMGIIVNEPWYADRAEMWEATNRLVSGGRTPKFPNEHMDALYRELREIRAIRQSHADEAYRRQWDDPERRPQCDLCDGTTLVVVPHPRCVWEGVLVNHPVNGKYYTVAVLCDFCELGKAACSREDERVNRAKDEELKKRPRLMTVSRYTAEIHGHDGVFLQTRYERDMAERSRRELGVDRKAFVEMYPRLAAKMVEALRRT